MTCWSALKTLAPPAAGPLQAPEAAAAAAGGAAAVPQLWRQRDAGLCWLRMGLPGPNPVHSRLPHQLVGCLWCAPRSLPLHSGAASIRLCILYCCLLCILQADDVHQTLRRYFVASYGHDATWITNYTPFINQYSVDGVLDMTIVNAAIPKQRIYLASVYWVLTTVRAINSM